MNYSRDLDPSIPRTEGLILPPQMTASVLKVNRSPLSSKEAKAIKGREGARGPNNYITPAHRYSVPPGWIFFVLSIPICGLHIALTPWMLNLVTLFSSWSDAHHVGSEDLSPIACISAGSLLLTSLCHEDRRSPGRTAPSSFFLDGSQPTVTNIWEISMCCYRLWDCIQDWGPGVFAIVANAAKPNHTNLSSFITPIS